MTKRLEELFNLPSEDEDTVEEATATPQDLEEIKDFEKSLRTDINLEQNDKELDDLAAKATDSFENLMDLGMNVEARFSAPIFDAASKLLGHAITAKTNKLEKKLRLMDLELKRRRVEIQEKDAGVHADGEGEARVIDRNEMLRMIKEANAKK